VLIVSILTLIILASKVLNFWWL